MFRIVEGVPGACAALGLTPRRLAKVAWAIAVLQPTAPADAGCHYVRSIFVAVHRVIVSFSLTRRAGCRGCHLDRFERTLLPVAVFCNERGACNERCDDDRRILAVGIGL